MTIISTGFRADECYLLVLRIDWPRATVKDAAGTEWNLSVRQLDCGADYCGPVGNWLHESHPKVIAALRAALLTNTAKQYPHGIGCDIEGYARHTC